MRDLSAVGLPRRSATRSRRAARTRCETPFDLERGPLLRARAPPARRREHVLIAHRAPHRVRRLVVRRDRQRPGDALRATARRGADPRRLAAAASATTRWRRPTADAAPKLAEADERYWLARFAGAMPVLELPTDRPRRRLAHLRLAARRSRARRGARRRRCARWVRAQRRQPLRHAARPASRRCCTPRRAATTSSSACPPPAGRSGAGDLVGHCVNLLPVRAARSTSTRAPGRVAGRSAQPACSTPSSTRATPSARCCRSCRCTRDPSRLPLVSVMFNLDQAIRATQLSFPGLGCASWPTRAASRTSTCSSTRARSTAAWCSSASTTPTSSTARRSPAGSICTHGAATRCCDGLRRVAETPPRLRPAAAGSPRRSTRLEAGATRR